MGKVLKKGFSNPTDQLMCPGKSDPWYFILFVGGTRANRPHPPELNFTIYAIEKVSYFL